MVLKNYYYYFYWNLLSAYSTNTFTKVFFFLFVLLQCPPAAPPPRTCIFIVSCGALFWKRYNIVIVTVCLWHSGHRNEWNYKNNVKRNMKNSKIISHKENRRSSSHRWDGHGDNSATDCPRSVYCAKRRQAWWCGGRLCPHTTHSR